MKKKKRKEQIRKAYSASDNTTHQIAQSEHESLSVELSASYRHEGRWKRCKLEAYKDWKQNFQSHVFRNE